MSEQKILGGTDGFRGPVDLRNPNMGHQNELTHYWLTSALIALQQEAGHDGPAVVLRDGNGRPSGLRLAPASIQAAQDHDVDVIYLDTAPTPVGQKIAEMTGALATIAVTASHNPVADNGWKGMLGSYKPDTDWVQAISKRAWEMYAEGKDRTPAFPITKLSVDPRGAEYKQRYAQTLTDKIEEEFDERPLAGKIIMYDGANGAANQMAPTILEALGATVHSINCSTGLINEACGATDLSALKTAILAEGLHNNPNFLGGIANDGDADRLMAVGVIEQAGHKKLVELDGNHAMYELAHGEPGIVGTVYTNSGLRDRLRAEGIAFQECGNGDQYVTQALQQRASDGWRRGGEFTGHLIDMDWLNGGDGVAMAAWLSANVAQRGETFGDTYRSLPLWRESMHKITLSGGVQFDTDDARFREAQDWAVAQMAGEGRAIVRPSGTEPVVRVWLESPNSSLPDRVGEVLRTKLYQELLAL